VIAAPLLELEHNALVVDASVGIKLFVEEQGSELAARIFDLLTANPPITLYVPDLFYIECTNILWKYTRHYDYPAESACENIADLLILALQTHIPHLGIKRLGNYSKSRILRIHCPNS